MPGSSFSWLKVFSTTTSRDVLIRSRRLHQPEPRLLVERWVVGEPEDHSTGVRLEVVVVVAVEQRLEHRRGHDGLAGAGGRGQRERDGPLLAVPVVPRVFEVAQHVADGVVLVVLERELIAATPARC